MQSFTTDDYKFEIDGVTYSIPELSIDAFGRIGDLYSITDPVKQVAAFQDALIAEADESTTAAIRKLGIRQATQLFRGWSGIGGATPGESKGSPEPQ